MVTIRGLKQKGLSQILSFRKAPLPMFGNDENAGEKGKENRDRSEGRQRVGVLSDDVNFIKNKSRF